jgi:hypothetical protein
MVERYRRPSQKWCTETGVRLVRIASREPFLVPRLLEPGDAQVLLKAAAIIDTLGQAIEAERVKMHV